jgi:hypothetical protein
LGELVGDQAADILALECLHHRRVERVVEDDEAGRADLPTREGLDGLEDGGPADLEVRSLLLREVVVEAVDDEQRDERQRDGDEQDQGNREPSLERPRAEVPDPLREGR